MFTAELPKSYLRIEYRNVRLEAWSDTEDKITKPLLKRLRLCTVLTTCGGVVCP